jgi:hypothetical protein
MLTTTNYQLLTRSFQIDIKDVDTFNIKTGKKEVKKRFRFPCHGDLVSSWTILIPSVRGYKPLQFKKFGFYVNDNLLNKVKGITYSNNLRNSVCKIDFSIIRNQLRNIEMPDTSRNNRLINIENQFANQGLECLQVPHQKNIKVDPVPKDILINTLFLGGICIEIDVEDYPLKTILISENYYDYISSKLYPKKEEKKEEKKSEIKEEKSEKKLSIVEELIEKIKRAEV